MWKYDYLFIKKIAIIIATKVIKIIKNYVVVSVLIKTQNELTHTIRITIFKNQNEAG